MNPADEGFTASLELGIALQAARNGHALKVGEGERVVRYYEARLQAQREAQMAALGRVETEEREKAARQVARAQERLTFALRREREQAATVKALQRLVRQLVWRIEMRFGAWHRGTIRRQLEQDPQIAEALRLQPRGVSCPSD